MTAIWLLLLGHLALTALLSVDLLLRRRKEPMATMAWLQAIALVPGLGALLYLIFGCETLHRRKYRKHAKAAGVVEARLGALTQTVADHILSCPPEDVGLHAAEALAIAIATSRRPPTRGNTVRVFDNVTVMYDDLEQEVAAAKSHVHFEYYIFQPDATGMRFLTLLAAKAREGVEVRLLLDAVGSWSLGEELLQPLVAAGGEVEWFLPLHKAFPRRLAIHLRNHRKIAIVDARVAYTGGVNIGDEYRGRRARRLSWRDTHLKVEGPAVHHLQEIFAEDWSFASEGKLLQDRHFPVQTPSGDAIIDVVPSGPDDPSRALHATLFHAIATARSQVWIATPYFVPDEAIATALATSARRGVDVRLLLPERTDHPLVDRAAESYLPELLEAGVKVYRYEAGMLHSKLVAVDGAWGILGSANMDIRSFRLNFEVNLVILSPSWIRSLEAIFQKDLTQSSPVTRTHFEALPLPHRLTVAACRLLAPVL